MVFCGRDDDEGDVRVAVQARVAEGPFVVFVDLAVDDGFGGSVDPEFVSDSRAEREEVD